DNTLIRLHLFVQLRWVLIRQIRDGERHVVSNTACVTPILQRRCYVMIHIIRNNRAEPFIVIFGEQTTFTLPLPKRLAAKVVEPTTAHTRCYVRNRVIVTKILVDKIVKRAHMLASFKTSLPI